MALLAVHCVVAVFSVSDIQFLELLINTQHLSLNKSTTRNEREFLWLYKLLIFCYKLIKDSCFKCDVN